MRLKLQVPLPDALFRALGISSRNGYQPELAESVQPVVIVKEDDATAITNALDDANSYIAGISTGPGAGAFSYVQLMNPAGSGQVVYVDEVILANMSAALVIAQGPREFDDDATLALLANGWLSTYIGAPLGVAKLRAQTNAGNLGTGNYGGEIALQAAQSLRIPLPKAIRLDPGRGVLWRASPVNVQFGVVFIGRQAAAA